MSSSTYGFLVHLAFEKNIDKPYCPSINQIVKVTDSLAKKLDCDVSDVSLSQKYRIVNELMEKKLLVTWRKGRKKRIRFSDKLKNYNLETMRTYQIISMDGQSSEQQVVPEELEPTEKKLPEKPQYNLKIREVALPITKISKVGLSSGIIIPKTMMTKHKLEQGMKVRPILHVKKETAKLDKDIS
jgi:hypothetical protein